MEMKSGEFLIDKIGGRSICLRGIGKLFYQEGFPILIAITELKKKGIEVSILHVADECLKNGWSPKTTLSKLKEDFEDGIDKNVYDMDLLYKFCHADYDEQRRIIFNYLFGSEAIALDWARNKMKHEHITTTHR